MIHRITHGKYSLKERFPALGFVPCPGHPGTAETVAATVARTAKALEDICHVLDGTGRGAWTGQAAEAFREKFDNDFKPKMKDAKKSFVKAARALTHWAEDMPNWQDEALKLEAKAQFQKDKAGHATHELGKIPVANPFDTPKSNSERKDQEKAENKRKHWGSVRDSANTELVNIRRAAETLARNYNDAGERVANQLDKAMDIAPDEPGLWDKIGDVVKTVGQALGALSEIQIDSINAVFDDAVDWIKDHAYAIGAIGDVFSTVSAMLGVLGLGLVACRRFSLPLR